MLWLKGGVVIVSGGKIVHSVVEVGSMFLTVSLICWCYFNVWI